MIATTWHHARKEYRMMITMTLLLAGVGQPA
jgi:hypothetical protein